MSKLDLIQAALDRAAYTPANKPSASPRPLPIASTPTYRTYAIEHERWEWFHDTLAKPVKPADRPAVWADILKLGDGLGCSCGAKWRKLMAAYPINWDNPEQWGVDRHNDVNRSLGKRADWTVEQARATAVFFDNGPSVA